MKQMNKKRWLVIVALAMMALVGGTLFLAAKPVQAAHTHSYRWVTKKNASCTSTGYRNYECSCGACLRSETIPKTPHNYNLNAATCTTAKKCRTCGYVAQAATGHSWNRASATCTASKSCTKCGAVGQAALGHAYCQVTTKQPTCGAAGTYETKCSRCGIGSPTGNGTIPPTGQHSWNRSSASCTEAKKCVNCGTIGQPALGHAYSQVTTKQPTCGTEGTYETKCSRCGIGSPTGNGTIPPTGKHTWNRSEATCTECKSCTTCGTVAEPKKAHNLRWVEVISPTCTSTGRRDYKCQDCGIVTDSQTLDKVPSHNLVFSNHVDGDCTHATYDWYKCKDCGTKVKRNVVKAKGHDYQWVITTHPTATSTGIETEICKTCNHEGASRNFTADPAIVTSGVGNSSALDVINSRMNKSDYIRQMWRSYTTTTTTGTTPTQNKDRGICTWCALTNLLNRRLALEKSDFANITKFTISDIAYVASGKAAVCDRTQWESSIYGERSSFIYIANYNGANYYHNVFSTHDGSYSIQVSDELKMNTSADNVEGRKKELAGILDQHPEGILIQFDNNNGGYHGFVLTGYYYENNALRFYALDTGNSNYYDAERNWPIEETYIGRTYSKNNSADNIFKNIRFYAVLEY